MVKNPIIAATSEFHFNGGDGYKFKISGCKLVKEESIDLITYMNNKKKLSYFG